MNRTSTVSLFVLVGLAAYAGRVAGGPINPPPGPVTSTYKTISDVEPRIAIGATDTPGNASCLYRISAPGSYYLTGNIQGAAGKHGILIDAPGVTLDLNGYDLAGVPGMGNFAGIVATISGRAAAIMNGTVHGWGGAGIDLGINNTHACRISGIRAYSNAGTGIVAGHITTITDCHAADNIGNGIQCGSDCVVSRCTTDSNHANGFYSTGLGVLVTNCASFENTLAGFHVDIGSSVIDCEAPYNKGDGIECTSQCTIRGNTCAGNGWNGGNGAGVHATGSRNRIEGNHCTLATRGIDVDGGANIIMRNTCSGNSTNWTIAAFNAVAPIVAVPGSAAAISGNTYSGSLSSTDPNANFTH